MNMFAFSLWELLTREDMVFSFADILHFHAPFRRTLLAIAKSRGRMGAVGRVRPSRQDALNINRSAYR